MQKLRIRRGKLEGIQTIVVGAKRSVYQLRYNPGMGLGQIQAHPGPHSGAENISAKTSERYHLRRTVRFADSVSRPVTVSCHIGVTTDRRRYMITVLHKLTFSRLPEISCLCHFAAFSRGPVPIKLLATWQHDCDRMDAG